MALDNLQPATGSTKDVKRVGRGQGSGMGKTSTRGQKGQNLDLDLKLKEVSKVVNNHYKRDFLKLDSFQE